MKVLKYISQILSAVVYSTLIAVVLYYSLTLPWIWGIELSGWKQALYVFVILGVLTVIASLIYTLCLYPYRWIAKKNIVATVISVIIIAVLSVFDCIRFWKVWLAYSSSWVLPIIITVSLIWLVVMSCIAIVVFYKDDE